MLVTIVHRLHSPCPPQVKDKIGVLKTLITKADIIVIGGRMAFTFLAALGTAIGRTQIEEDW